MRISISDLTQGPAALETVFSDRIKPKYVQADTKYSWYRDLISLIQKQGPGFWKKDKIAYYFCLGYLQYQSTQFIAEGPERQAVLASALEQLRRVDRVGKKYRELEYYAVFLQASILEMQGIGWPDVEEAYLHAYEVYPDRAESLAQVVQHYFHVQQPAIAYIFTTYSKDHHFNNIPGNDKWLLDPELYNWKVLDMHTAACYGMGKIEEATDTFLTLLGRVEQQPQLFSAEQAKQLQEKKQFFIQHETNGQDSAQLHLQK